MQKVLQFTIDLSDYMPRKSITQEQVEQQFDEVFVSFVHSVKDAFIETKTALKAIERHKRGRNLPAVLMNGRVCGLMLDAHPGTVRKMKYGRIGCVIDGTVAYFKMMDKKHKPKHVTTINSVALVENLRHRSQQEETVLWLGWTVSPDWSTITGIYANFMKNGKRVWEVDLNDWMLSRALPRNTEKVKDEEPTLKSGVRKKKAEGE